MKCGEQGLFSSEISDFRSDRWYGIKPVTEVISISLLKIFMNFFLYVHKTGESELFYVHREALESLGEWRLQSGRTSNFVETKMWQI